MEAANKNTAFADRDWHISDAKCETNASSCCPHMDSTENFEMPLIGYFGAIITLDLTKPELHITSKTILYLASDMKHTCINTCERLATTMSL
jgi:hypothetical protein